MRQGGIRVRAVWLFVIGSGKGEGRMSSGNGPREIVVRRKQHTANGSPTMGFGATDRQTGAHIWLPSPIKDGDRFTEGREAAEIVAGKLLPDGARLLWSRDTPETYVFTVAGA